MYRIAKIIVVAWLTLFLSSNAENCKILFVVDTFPEYTFSGIIHQLVAAKKANFDVSIHAVEVSSCTYNDPALIEYDLLGKIYVQDIPTDLSSYQIILCQSGALAHTYSVLKKKLGLKAHIITYIHKTDLSLDLFKRATIGRTFFVDVDKFICDSLYTKHQLELRGCKSSRITVIPTPVDIKKFQFRLAVLDPQDTIRFISVGPLNECRPYQDIIRLLKERLLKNNPHLKLVYTIVGEGSCYEQITQAISDYKMENYVELVGWCSADTVAELLSKSHIFLLPLCTTYDGVQEGIPDCLKEAMAVGTIVVTTRHGGIHEIVKNGLTGILVPERDISYFGSCLLSLIKHSELWPSMQLNARKLVEQTYNIERFERRFSKLLYSLC